MITFDSLPSFSSSSLSLGTPSNCSLNALLAALNLLRAMSFSLREDSISGVHFSVKIDLEAS